METKLGRIASKSANTKRPEFTSLYHLINKEMLTQCHRELDGSKAVGVDEVTKSVPSPKKQTKNAGKKPNEKNDKYNTKLLYWTAFIPRFA